LKIHFPAEQEQTVIANSGATSKNKDIKNVKAYIDEPWQLKLLPGYVTHPGNKL
jgi:hypothetical protein